MLHRELELFKSTGIVQMCVASDRPVCDRRGSKESFPGMQLRGCVGWAKRSVPTILIGAGMVGTAQTRLCPAHEIPIFKRQTRSHSLPQRHCERSEAIHCLTNKESWIASRSLSSGARSRDPLARNDDLHT
jgi:hypothetical protein